MEHNKVFNQKIRDILIEKRKQKGWTKAELSRRTHISQQLLCDIESGRRNPSLNSIVAIAKALELSLDKILL